MGLGLRDKLFDKAPGVIVLDQVVSHQACGFFSIGDAGAPCRQVLNDSGDRSPGSDECPWRSFTSPPNDRINVDIILPQPGQRIRPLPGSLAAKTAEAELW